MGMGVLCLQSPQVNFSFAVELRLSLSWRFPAGYPCEDLAQLEAMETVNSKPISKANHRASDAAVVVAMLCPHSEGCELLKQLLTQVATSQGSDDSWS